MRLTALPALSDNYIWLLADASRRAVVIDPGEEAPVRAACERAGLRLTAILLTHHHPDHIAGAAGLASWSGASVYAPHDKRIESADVRLGDGDTVNLDEPKLDFAVIATPGHTSSHIAYHGQGLLFCGDTLFSVGCGHPFEGSPAQLLTSLDRLASLPDDTLVCCGHEYTRVNCAFARMLDPDNEALRLREMQVVTLRAQGMPTLPVSLSEERACNPFLRVDSAALIAALDPAKSHDRIERFAELRQRKDEFRMPAP
ncbi:MAG: hydroxyacylglutathione hydrolase [Dokdonella sp.]